MQDSLHDTDTSLRELYNRAVKLRLLKASLTVGTPEWLDANNRLLRVTCKIASLQMKKK